MRLVCFLNPISNGSRLLSNAFSDAIFGVSVDKNPETKNISTRPPFRLDPLVFRGVRTTFDDTVYTETYVRTGP